MKLGGHKAPALACGLMGVTGNIGAIFITLLSSFIDFNIVFCKYSIIIIMCIYWHRNIDIKIKNNNRNTPSITSFEFENKINSNSFYLLIVFIIFEIT